MARRAVLGGGTLNPFGGAGVDFGAFDIAATDTQSQLILTKVETRWNAGQASDQEYLDALKAYAGTLAQNTTQRLNADQRVEQMTYRVERSVLVAKVDAGTKSINDLMAYDKGKLSGLNTDSQEYRDRLDQYHSTQQQAFSDQEKDIVQSYNDGHMTTAALNSWYAARKIDPNFSDNKDITDNIDTRMHDLDNRVLQERDSQAMSDYQNGKMAPAAFISYATNARARYANGSQDFKDWTQRINDAHDKSIETALLYRYDLSQQYAQLQKFIASSKAPAGSKGHTTTSKSTRVILGTDGAWHTVTTTSSKYHPPAGPSAAEQQAMRNRNIEVADAKRQMAEIQRKIAGVGGFVATPTVIHYYQGQQGKFAKGSDEWYAVQGKLDQLNDRLHQESVLSHEGIKISYPKVASSPSGGASGGSSKGSSTKAAAPRSDTANINIDDFMRAIAHVESGGRYTAVNKTSGAKGKYQIMPANWPGWASKYLGNANAPMTPENQEKVAKGKFTDLYKWLGDWRAVAHWWLTGGSDKNTHLNPSAWSSSSRQYVDKVFAGMGQGPTSGSTLQANAKGSFVGGTRPPSATGTGKPSAAVAARTTHVPGAPTKDTGGPLRVITGYTSGPKGLHITNTVGASLPKNMDGAAFDKFYSQYEAAFKSGATEFSVNEAGKTVHYWIGDDTIERRDGMRKMDELKISLQRTKAQAYAGTPSEITAMNGYDNAVEAAAKHELIILDTYEQKGTSTGPPGRNASPIGSGLALMNKTKQAIDDHMTAADAAMKRGDLTSAYDHYQMAADLRASAESTLQQYSAASQAAVAAVEKSYGVGRDEALGVAGRDQLAKDLNDLANAGTTLDEALAKGSDNLSLLQSIIKKDANGNAVFDSAGPGGQLQMADNWHFEIKGDGSVEPVKTQATGYDYNGKQTHDLKDMVRVDYLSGNQVVTAYTKYQTGTVGHIVAKDGTLIPITGKTMTRRRSDGTDELWVEDPFNPGHWSSTQIVYQAPASFSSEVDSKGNQVFHFGGGGGPTTPAQARTGQSGDGSTYTLQWDPSTNTYVVYRSKPGGLFQQGVTDEPLGSLSAGSFAQQAFQQAGWSRDLSNVSSNDLTFANMGSPFLGATADQYRNYLSNFQSPYKDNSQDQIERMRGMYSPGTSNDPSKSGIVVNHGFTLTPAEQQGRIDETAARLHAADQLAYDQHVVKTGFTLTPLQQQGRINETKARLDAANTLAKLTPLVGPSAKPTTKPTLPAPVKTGYVVPKNQQAARQQQAAAARAAADKKAKAAAARAAAAKKAAAQHQAITGHAIGHGPTE